MILNARECETLRALWRCGVATKRQLREAFGIKDHRFRRLLQDGYVDAYLGEVRLGEYGRETCRWDMQLRFPYEPKYRQIRHDLKLMSFYLSLSSEIRETWKTERQLYDENQADPSFAWLRFVLEEMGQTFAAVPDGAFYSENHQGFVAVEVITRSYTAKRVDQKRRFAELFMNGIVLIELLEGGGRLEFAGKDSGLS